MRLIKYQPLHFITLWSGYPHTQILTRRHRLGKEKVKMLIELLHSLWYLWWVQITIQTYSACYFELFIKWSNWNYIVDQSKIHKIPMMLAVLQVLGLNQRVLRNILLKSVHCKPIQGRTGIKQGNPVSITIIFHYNFSVRNPVFITGNGFAVCKDTQTGK